MTSNQIAYWNYRETIRHNVETEKESKRHNVSTESYSLRQLEESKRHNIVSESLGFSNLEESRRHNLAQESIGWYGAYTTRSLATAQIGLLSAQEEHTRAETENEAYRGDVLKSQARLNNSSTVRNYVEAVSSGLRTVQNVLNPFNWVTPQKLFE